MIKQQQFYVFRINSARLKESNYDINLTIKEARDNKELISLGDSELLRQIRDYDQIDINYLDNLLYLKNTIKKFNSSEKHIKRLVEIQNIIDDILFIPEVVVVNIRTNSQYNKMFLNNIKINGQVFKRFIVGSGHSRNSKTIFVEEETLNRIKPKLENGYDKSKELSPSKYNAYFGLYSSNTYKVSNLKFCVVKDLIINIERDVDFVCQDDDKNFKVKKIENHSIELKPHDGEGLITLNGTKAWCKDLKVEDYIPSFFGIRNSYIKGMLINFPVEDYYNSLESSLFIDVWGDTRDAKDYDIFLTASQIKLWKSYKSLEDFTENLEKNNLSWGVCHVAPNKDEHYHLTNYQYLQTLDMNENDIKELCKFNIEWFKDILGADPIHTALYLLGKGVNAVSDIDDINNPLVKAILLNNKLANDPYIKNKINNSIRKRIQNTYAGRILVRGNYQTMLADPYSLCQGIFSKEPDNCKGLLAEGEHYSAYWNKYSVKKVDACRSPLTHYSEHNILNLKDDEFTKKWYKYQTTGIIYPTVGLDTIRHADSDFDLDIVFTTSDSTFLKCVYKDTLPITYEKKSTPTAIITDVNLFQADLLSFNNDIGMITNYSTEMYAMLKRFNKGSKAYNEILNRLKITRMLQGNAIDKAKGIQVEEFPRSWVRYQHITYKDEYDKEGNLIKEADILEVIKHKKFLNKLVINKKPYFQGYIYPKYRKQFKSYISKAELYCKITFGCTLDELKNKDNKTKEEKDFFRFHYKNTPLDISPCVMNLLCEYMEGIGEDIKKDIKTNFNNIEEIISILKDNSVPFNNDIFEKILVLYNRFCDIKRTHAKTVKQSGDKIDQESYEALQMFYEKIRNEAYQQCSNTVELINYVVKIVYELYPKDKKDFLWDVFQEDVLVNVIKNKQDIVYFPVLNEGGDIEYLGNKFKLEEVKFDI